MVRVKPRILILDIETSYKLAGVWGRFNQNIAMNQVLQDTYTLCWAAKWLDDDYIYSDALFNHKDVYRKDPTNDSAILETVWDMLDQADFVIAHNGERFDSIVLNSRFIQNGMKPPSTYQVIDTLKTARRSFKFTSNRLGDLAETLGLGGKLDTGGFTLWRDVIGGNLKAFKKMVAYCEQDVLLLEDVYKALRPWDKKHPSFVVLSDSSTPKCNSCGSGHIKKNGTYFTYTQRYQKYICKDCGHSMRSRYSEKVDKKTKHNILRSV